MLALCFHGHLKIIWHFHDPFTPLDSLRGRRDFPGPQTYGRRCVELLILEANNRVFLFQGKLFHFIPIVKNMVFCFLHVYENYGAAVTRRPWATVASKCQWRARNSETISSEH